MKMPFQDALIVQWGWITPGTNDYLRHEQLDGHIAFLAQPPGPAERRLALVHCGWWLDTQAPPAVRALTSRNPEPHRHLQPCRPRDLAPLLPYFRSGRLEFVVYPYAACVAEATSAEALFRSLRFSRDIARQTFGRVSPVCFMHDASYDLDWAAVQTPQIASLLGFKAIAASVQATVQAPDGTRLRAVGAMCRFSDLINLAPDPHRPVCLAIELHNHIESVPDLSRRKGAFQSMRCALRSISVEQYLRRSPSGPAVDSRLMGSKSWYGGVTSSLLMEQNVKSVELRLPAIEALAALSGAVPAGRHAAKLETLWKKTLILMDNHTLWQCHNYAAHYLPQSLKLAQEAHALEAALLGSRPAASNVVLFNPTPWTRDIAVQEGGRDLVAKAVPGWGARVVDRARPAPPRKDADPFTLSNDLATFRLNSQGETVAIQNSAARAAFNGLGRVLRIHERPSREQFTLAAGREISGIEGALEATAQIELPAVPSHEFFVTVPEITGAAYLMRVERIAASGAVVETEWAPVHNLHWGGGGMPRHQTCVGPRRFAAAGARRVRVTLWLLAQGAAALAPLRLWLRGAGDRFVESPSWRVRVLYRNAYTPLAGAKARVVHSSAALKTVRFTGALPGARCQLDATLRAGSRALEYTLRLLFPRPTPLGLSSPPLGEIDGSILGAECERPYVPGVAVLFPLPSQASYSADQPAFIRQALQSSPRTWHTDRRDWWLGMSPFIGMNLAAADYGAAQLGLLTRGLKHFFRWRRAGAESLGLSLGATLIHPSTQGHSVPPSSPWYDILKRTSHNPYFDTSFLRATGEHVFHYAVQLAPPGQAGAFDLWRAAQEFALPAHALPVDAPPGAALPGVEASPSTVVVTAVEPDGPRLRLRLVNMSSRAVLGRVRLPFQSRPVAGAPARLRSGAIEAHLPPWAFREITLERADPSEEKANA